MRRPLLAIVLLSLAGPALARHGGPWCGTTAETREETAFLHRQALRARAAGQGLRPLTIPPLSGNRDIGNIAIIEDAGGVVVRQNQFNLDLKTLQFTPFAPQAARYRFSVADQGYEAAAATNGTPLAALDDDDTRAVALPFSFPFFGATYNQVYVNSDGNLTFTTGDAASIDRSLGRMTAGPPRISPLFDDLDPSQTSGGVRVLSDPNRVVVSWVGVPEWESFGTGPRQTFQAKLYPDGRIEFSYSGVTGTNAVVGIAPGNLKGSTTLVDFRNDPSADYSAAVAERFGDSLAVDVVTTAQTFYQTHEDAYDYLVIYNNMDISAMGSGVLAYESTARSAGTGYGVPVQDSGQLYGSAARLQSLMNMGPLSQYPTDPNALVPLRAPQGDTPITTLAHEAGHLFLAFASILDPNDPTARPMLGYGGSHWSFVFNSEASLLEGERIVDRGTATSPQFLTTDTVQGYAPLDQYLMGFRPAGDVPDTFLVTGTPAYMTQWHPLRNFGFDGTRQNISVTDVAQAMGRRTPDSTVAQRRFRFAFILVVAQGSTPSSDVLSKVDTFRQQFEAFYAKASSNNGAADTSLKRSLQLSLFPSSGVASGGAATGTLTIQKPATADLTVQFLTPNGNARLPASVKIPAGEVSASFTATGVRPGVEEVSAMPVDSAYETSFARLQVADASLLKLVPTSATTPVSNSANPQPAPVLVSLTDANRLVYPGARILATASAGGSVIPPAADTDSQGVAAFRWTPGPSASNQLHLSVEAQPAVTLTIGAGAGVPGVSAVVNAASSNSGIAAGSLQTVYGVSLAGGGTASAGYPWPSTLAGVQVLVNGSPMPLSYVSDTQVNIYVPQTTPLGTATLIVVTPSAGQATSTVNVTSFQPGIFPGAVLHAGTAVSAVTSPVHAGDYIEIYCTGLGPTKLVNGLEQTLVPPTVFLGAVPLQPVYSGLVPGLEGLYQVDVQIPSGPASGSQTLLISVNNTRSNEVSITVQ